MNTVAEGGGRPGAWPDPDMLEVGNGINNPQEEMARFSLWCVISAPLILGNDVRDMYSYVKHILGNTEAIAVNQDNAFNDQKLVATRPDCSEVWAKPLEGGAKAVVLFNKTDARATLSVSWDEIGLPPGVAQVRDLWEHTNLGTFTDTHAASVPSHGCAFVKTVSGNNPIPKPPATLVPNPQPLHVTPLKKSGWTITASPANVYDKAKGNPHRLIDDDVDTAYSINPTQESGHWGIIDMKSPQTFNAVVRDGDKKGPNIPPYESDSMVHRWEVFTCDDGATWGRPVGTGMWGPRATTALMRFPEQTARYVKIVYSRTVETSNDPGGWGAEEGVDELYVANVEGDTRQEE
ncbi:discoidin domain-containing protein [bacterium]|nr:discoidin domain-containing protein [bacterium]